MKLQYVVCLSYSVMIFVSVTQNATFADRDV